MRVDAVVVRFLKELAEFANRRNGSRDWVGATVDKDRNKVYGQQKEWGFGVAHRHGGRS